MPTSAYLIMNNNVFKDRDDFLIYMFDSISSLDPGGSYLRDPN